MLTVVWYYNMKSPVVLRSDYFPPRPKEMTFVPVFLVRCFSVWCIGGYKNGLAITAPSGKEKILPSFGNGTARQCTKCQMDQGKRARVARLARRGAMGPRSIEHLGIKY